MPAPSLNRAIDCGPSAQSLATSVSRVGSPSAANIGAASRNLSPALRARDMTFDVARLVRPPVVVHAERLIAAAHRNLVEPGLDDGQQRTFIAFLQPELDKCRRLLRIILRRIDRVRVPSPGEVAFGVNPLDEYVHRQVFVTGMRDLAPDVCAFDERSLQLDAEPAAELVGVGEGAPHPRPRGAQHNLFLDSIGRRRDHMQPPGCLTIRARESLCNLNVAYWRWRRRWRPWCRVPRSGSVATVSSKASLRASCTAPA